MASYTGSLGKATGLGTTKRERPSPSNEQLALTRCSPTSNYNGKLNLEKSNILRVIGSSHGQAHLPTTLFHAVS